MSNKCPGCGNEYERLSQHWFGSPSHRPSLSHLQRCVIDGVLMGDGCISSSSKNPRLVVNMTNREYLEYLDSIFGILSTGVKKSKSAKQSAADARRGGFAPDADGESYSDQYTLRTRTVPELHGWRMWYDSGEKVIPESMTLTPETLTHWYVCDGSLHTSGGRGLSIHTKNEIDNVGKLSRIFTRQGLPGPDSVYEHAIAWFGDNSDELFEFMGGEVPGYGYKFPQ